MKNKLLIFALLCVLLTFPLLFSGCSAGQSGQDMQDLCTDMVEAVMADRFDDAFSLCNEACTAQEFRPVWNEMRAVLGGASSYELKQTGHSVHMSEGITSTVGSFELTTNNGKTCQLELTVTDGVNGLSSFFFSDSTEFLEKTSFIPFINIGMILLSLATLAFCVWMVVDCAKRPLKSKAGWIILILVGISFSVLISSQDFDFDFAAHLFFSFSYITRDAATHGIGARVILPVGAVIYFFVRKRITKLASPEESAASDTSATDSK